MASTPRDAATVILARRTPDGSYEVLLTRRPETMKFMGGTYVFPGGALDEDDYCEELASRSALAADDARARLGEDIPAEQALGLYCCGVREVFEEVGVLLARDGSGADVPPDAVERYATRRDEIGDDAKAFAAFLATEDLMLATDGLVPHGRLVTPENVPIRFDARFFVAPFPEGQSLLPDPDEVPDVLWMRPWDAIRAAHAKELPVPIPTMAILQGLAEIPSYEQLLRTERPQQAAESGPLTDLVSYVLAPNPGLMTGPGTNTFIVGRERVAIIDPAVPDPRYIEAVTREAGNRGRPEIILLTHLHSDHIGGVAVLAEQLRCEVGAWRGVADDAPFVTLPINDGEVVDLGGARLEAIHTPGHASHHLCYHLLEENALFAGDVVAGVGTVVISPPDGNMAAYLATLERLRGLGLDRIYPAHGPATEDPDGKLSEYITHRRDRERQVLDALEAGLVTTPEMVKRIYTDVSEALHPVAEMSVLAHLEMLEAEGRVRREDGVWRLANA